GTFLGRRFCQPGRKNADCATRRALIRAFIRRVWTSWEEELATRRFSMMRTLARRTKVWRLRTRGAGVLPARRNTRHSIRATSATAFIGTTAAAAAFFCPYGAFEPLRLPHLAANPPLQLAHLATTVRPLGRCPRLSAPPGPRAGAT